MHRSRINGVLIDRKADDIDAAAQFWAHALGRPVDMKLRDPGAVTVCWKLRQMNSACRYSAWTTKAVCT
jgi:hypothetical protein